MQRTASAVAIDTVAADLTQQQGRSIKGNVVALKVGGNAGQFVQGTSNDEIVIDAPRVVLDVGGDAIVKKTSGPLEVVSTANIGGDTYTSTGAGQDLRVVTEGDLTLSTPTR